MGASRGAVGPRCLGLFEPLPCNRLYSGSSEKSIPKSIYPTTLPICTLALEFGLTMATVWPEGSQDPARRFVREALGKRRPRKGGQRWLADAANVGYGTLNNWLGGRQNMGTNSLESIAKVLGVTIEQMFYNGPDDPEPETIPEEWQTAVREIERFVRSITDPVRRESVAMRLRAVALGEVEAFERDETRRAGAGRHSGGAEVAPRPNSGRPR